MAGGDQFVEDGVTAKGAGGFFKSLSVLRGAGAGVDRAGEERDVEAGAETGDEGLVGVGFFAAQTVVDVDGGEAHTEGVARQRVGCVCEEQERGGVGSAREGDGDAVAGLERCGRERQGCSHPLVIVGQLCVYL